MRHLAFAIALAPVLALPALAAPALADQTQSAPPAPASPAPQAAYAVEKTPLETLGADPKARAAVEKHLPGLFQHPAYEMIKSMPLKAIQPYSQGKITDDILTAIQTDLDALR